MGTGINGRARVGHRTKDLARVLRPGEIAIIDHCDLDEVAVESLVRARVRAVVNARESVSGDYPNLYPLRLIDAGIPVLDAVGPEVLENVKTGEWLEIKADRLLYKGREMARGILLSREIVLERTAAAYEHLARRLLEFAQNTLEYASREIELLGQQLHTAELPIRLQGRQVLIVVRGPGYRDDLRAIRPYMREMHPFLIGVDGGADALLECGYRPHLIIGDMDSVSDRALRCGAVLVVHAYADGSAPGLRRVQELGLSAHVLSAVGTSEDVAMLLAYEMGANLIVAVGSHSNLLDFLGKGRRGMASTLLVRLKIGPLLVDAKGVSRLYPRKFRLAYVVELMLAAMLPLGIVLLASPTIYQLIRLFFLRWQVASTP